MNTREGPVLGHPTMKVESQAPGRFQTHYLIITRRVSSCCFTSTESRVPTTQLELRTGLRELFLGRLLNERHFFMYYLKLNYNRTSFMELCQKVLEMIKF